MWTVWWVWVVAGFALGTVEVLVPGYIFVGFAIGAVATGLLLAAGLLGDAPAPLMLVFAFASLAAWLALRMIFGPPGEKKKIWDRDINDN